MLYSLARSFTLSRALIVAFAALGYFFSPSIHEGVSVPLSAPAPWFLSAWYHWDANWYMSIAQHGYEWVAGQQCNVAFFPLYPWMMHFFGWFLRGQYLLAGILISISCLLGGFTYLYRLIRLDFNERIADRAIWLLAIFPTSFFFNAVFTESLFLLTSVACFYYGRRGRWALAGGWGLLASLTRISGLLLLVPLAFEFLSRRGFSPARSLRPALLWLSLIPAGVAVYSAYLYASFGQPLAFASAQASGWGHVITPFWQSFASEFHSLFSYGVIWDAAATLLLAACIVLGLKKLPVSYSLYALVSLLFPLSGGTMASMSRYVLVVFPMFIILAIQSRRKPFYWTISACFLLLLAVSTAAFATGRWIA